MVQGSNPGRDKLLSSSQKHLDQLPLAQWVEDFFQGCDTAEAGFRVIFWEPECRGVYSI